MFSHFKHSPPTKEIAKKKGDHLVDLNLDYRLKPTSVPKFQKSGHGSSHKPLPSQKLVNRLVTGNTYAIGSAKADDDEVYYPHGDLGLFGCVFEAWKNHWVLRTRPEDWWLPVACRIARAIDEAANPRYYGSDKVRDLFVSHKGKENIAVEIPVYTIDQVNYDHVFGAFASALEEKIKVPEFTRVMQNNFSTSSSTHKIASQINLMASMQEFFSFDMMLCGCGLRGLEMSGSIEDWESLPVKLHCVREILKPIEGYLNLDSSWWDHVLDVFRDLAMTRKTPDDPAVAKFWINILMDTTDTKWVGGGGSLPGKPVEVQAYNGWLIRFLTGDEKILAEDLGLHGAGSKEVREKLSGFNQVPMKVILTWVEPAIEDTSTLVSGMFGFTLHEGGDGGGEGSDEAVPSVEPNHMWAMLLPPSSPLRRRSRSAKVMKE